VDQVRTTQREEPAPAQVRLFFVLLRSVKSSSERQIVIDRIRDRIREQWMGHETSMAMEFNGKGEPVPLGEAA